MTWLGRAKKRFLRLSERRGDTRAAAAHQINHAMESLLPRLPWRRRHQLMVPDAFRIATVAAMITTNQNTIEIVLSWGTPGSGLSDM
jgi:hypothetical protein